MHFIHARWSTSVSTAQSAPRVMFVLTQPGCSSTDVTPSSLRSIDMDVLTAEKEHQASSSCLGITVQQSLW